MLQAGSATLLLATLKSQGCPFVPELTLRVMTRGASRMPTFCMHGCVRGDAGNPRPYRNLIDLLLSSNSTILSLANTAVFI